MTTLFKKIPARTTWKIWMALVITAGLSLHFFYSQRTATPGKSEILEVKSATDRTYSEKQDEREIVRGLVCKLKSHSPKTRWNAAANLGAMRRRPAVPALIKALKDRDWRVRMMSAWALGRIQDKKSAVFLTKLIDDPWLEVRPIAVWASGKIGASSSVAPLGRALFLQNDIGLKEEIIKALARIGDKSATPALIKALKDPDVRVRRTAALALGAIRDERAVTPLIEALDDPKDRVIANALRALAVYDAPQALNRISFLKNGGNPMVTVAAKRAYEKINSGKPAKTLIIDNPVEIYEKGDADFDRPALHLDSIMDYNPEDTHNLETFPIKLGRKIDMESALEGMNSSAAVIRCESAWMLGNSRDKTAVIPLMDALKDDNPSVRWNAAKALGKIGDKRAFGPLVIMLKDPDDAVREDAVEALGRLKDNRAVEVIGKFIKNEKHGYVRAKAAETLGRLGGEESLKILHRLLKDPDAEVRLIAVVGIARIGNKGSVAKLKPMKSDNNKTVRKTADAAVKILQGRMKPDELKIYLDALR